MAFKIWAKVGHDGWVFEDPSHVYRLPTGRLVRRFASVFKLLLSNEMLAQAVGRKLVRALQVHKFRKGAPVVIVAHSEASYFVARMLLRGRNIGEDVHVRKLPPATPDDLPVYIFADAIYRGETLTGLLRSIPAAAGVICVLNLRPFSPELGESDFSRLTSLLTLPFDPREVSPGSSVNWTHELEVDAVTHIPEEGARSERVRIGANHEIDVFFDASRDMLRHGIHWENARIHTVSLSVSDLTERHGASVLAWIVQLVGEFLIQEDHEFPLDLVVFTRYEASIGKLVPALCQALRQSAAKSVSRVFSVVLPFAPTEPREVFGRISGDLLTGIAEALVERMQFTLEPPGPFLALFLDDHCVTGNNLRNFLIRSVTSKIGRRPSSILAIPVVSRLGPGEEFFLSTLCSRLSSPFKGQGQVPFRFQCLFRLQVRSVDAVPSTSVYSFLERCWASSRLMSERMRAYLDGLRERLRSLQSGGTLGLPVVRHPFDRSNALDDRPVSPRIIRIRHLIALHQQNVGVLGELLREGLKAFEEREYDMLALFALEPSLLETPALQKAWSHDLSDLAVHGLKHSAHSFVKSDALVVLALVSDGIFARLVEVLPYICTDDDLVDQFLVLSLVVSPSNEPWADSILGALGWCGAKIAAEHGAYIRSVTTSVSYLYGQAAIRTLTDAHSALDRFVGGLSLHGQWLQPLTSIGDWLSRREVERNSSSLADVSAKVRGAADVMRHIVLPAIEGLKLIAKRREEILVSSELEDARVELVHCINLLLETVGSIGSERINKSIAQGIEALWNKIRENTFTTSPNIFLGIPKRDDVGGVLEDVMRRMFSAPVDVVRNLVRVQLPGAKVDAAWERSDGHPSIVWAPYPVERVVEVSRLLLQDIAQHGLEGSTRIEFSLEHSGGRQVLSGRFLNIVKPDDAPSGGKSQSRVSAVAREIGLGIKFDAPKGPGEIYEALVQFHDSRYTRSE